MSEAFWHAETIDETLQRLRSTRNGPTEADAARRLHDPELARDLAEDGDARLLRELDERCAVFGEPERRGASDDETSLGP